MHPAEYEIFSFVLSQAGMQEVEDAYKASLEVAEQKLTASIDHLMCSIHVLHSVGTMT